jgi:hypothetical protein
VPTAVPEQAAGEPTVPLSVSIPGRTTALCVQLPESVLGEARAAHELDTRLASEGFTRVFEAARKNIDKQRRAVGAGGGKGEGAEEGDSTAMLQALQAQVQERKSAVLAALGGGERLLRAGKAAEALAQLRRAAELAPGDARARALGAQVRGARRGAGGGMRIHTHAHKHTHTYIDTHACTCIHTHTHTHTHIHV